MPVPYSAATDALEEYRQRRAEREMRVPEEWRVCEACDGEGEVGTGRMSHSVNSATIDPPWEITERCPECNGRGGSVYEREADALLSSQDRGEK